MDERRATQLIDFLQTVDRLKSVYRATYLTTEDRHENDAEHVAHMALFAMLLAPETDLKLDMARVFELVLVHDLVEVIAGDTWAYDLQARAAAREREERAAEELFGSVPDDVRDRLMAAWFEFEDGGSPEARFVRAMDRLQGFSQNVFSHGRSWRERGVTRDMTWDRNRMIAETDPALRTVFESLYDRADGEQLWDAPTDELVEGPN